MKLEKINENKVRIYFDIEDLQKNNVDFHSFMSNSIDSQKIFLYMLQEAEKKLGFTTKDCKILIETISIPDDSFILTITKESNEEYSTTPSCNFNNSLVTTSYKHSIYAFDSIDSFCDFVSSLDIDLLKCINNSSCKMSLYCYMNTYYLVVQDINSNCVFLDKFHSRIVEFASCLDNSGTFACKLMEYGDLIFKDDAITSCLKYFVRKDF